MPQTQPGMNTTMPSDLLTTYIVAVEEDWAT